MPGKVASQKQDLPTVTSEPTQAIRRYYIEDYRYAEVEVTELTTAAYVRKENAKQIAEKMQQIINVEAPIEYERLVKKTLRAFHISRSSSQTLEATEKALKKVSAKTKRQTGIKFYWTKNQNPDLYNVYRKDNNSSEKRSADEVCQQELKNAVCFTLQENGGLAREVLIKETIYTMGYSRSGAALTAAVERGIKYGCKTGEIVQDSEKKFTLATDICIE